MFRSILGFAVLAVLAWLGLKLIFGILGSLVGLAMTVLWLAFIGFVVYLALRLVRPRTAERIRDIIKGPPPHPSEISQGRGRLQRAGPHFLLSPHPTQTTIAPPPSPHGPRRL